MKLLWINILSLMISVKTIAQPDKTIQNFNFWSGFELGLPLREGGRWGGYAEGQIKRANVIENGMSWFLRLGANYYLKNGDKISGGWAVQYNIPYDDASLPYSWVDWRLWQQYGMTNKTRKNPEHSWGHRFRLEERWLGRRYKTGTTTEGYDYYKFETTFRYMLKTQWYLTRRFGISLSDEVHLRLLSSEHGEKLVDQNRAYAGIIYAFNDKRHSRVETGYMHQGVWNATDEPILRVRVNHTWRVTFYADIPLSKKRTVSGDDHDK